MKKLQKKFWRTAFPLTFVHEEGFEGVFEGQTHPQPHTKPTRTHTRHSAGRFFSEKNTWEMWIIMEIE